MDFSTREPRQTIVEDQSSSPGRIPVQVGGTATQVICDPMPSIQRRGGVWEAGIPRLNRLVAVLLAVFLALIPLPFAANNSLSWLAAGVFLMLLCACYLAAVNHMDPRRPSALRHVRLVLGLAAVVVLGGMVQLVPHGVLRLPQMPEAIQLRLGTMAQSATELAVLRLISYAALFVLVVDCRHSHGRVVQMLRWIYAGVVVHAIWALMLLTVLQDLPLFAAKTAYRDVATGVFVNRNAFASYLAMGGTIGVGLMLHTALASEREEARRPAWRRYWSSTLLLQVGCLGLVWIVLVATGSRMGAVVGCLGVGCVAVLMLRQHGVPTWQVGAWVGGMMLALWALLFLSGHSVTAERLMFTLSAGEARPELFRQTWQMILASPWLGYGLDTYPLAFEVYREEGLRPDLTWQAPHNTYLTLWVEYGLGLGSVTMLLCAALLYQLVQGLRGQGRDVLPTAIAVAVIFLTAVHALVDFSLEIAANTYLFITLVALGLPFDARGQS